MVSACNGMIGLLRDVYNLPSQFRLAVGGDAIIFKD